MSELKFKYLNEIDISSSLTDSAHVIVEDGGSIKRAPMNQLVVEGGVSSWNELEDKPFYVEGSGATIEWDGNAEGRDSFAMSSGVVLYKVSDLTPTKTELVGSVIVSNTGDELQLPEEWLLESSSFLNIGEAGCVAYEDGQITGASGTYIVPSTGVYFVEMEGAYISKLTYGSTTIHTLDEKFIPDTIARVSDIPEGSAQVNPDMAQNDSTQPDYVKNRTHWVEGNQTVIEWDGNTEGRDSFSVSGTTVYKISDETPTTTDLTGGTLQVDDSPDGALTEISFYEVEGGFGVGPNLLVVQSADAFAAPSTGVYATPCSTLTLTYGSTTYHPLDEAFIPDTIARTADIPEVNYPVTSVNGMTGDVVIEGGSSGGVTSWNELTDRPFYEEGSGATIEWDGNTEGREVAFTCWGSDFYKVSDEVATYDDLIGGEFFFVGPTGTQGGTLSEQDIEEGTNCYFVGDGMAAIILQPEFEIDGIALSAPSTGVYFACYSGVAYATKLSYGNLTIHKLDPKFLSKPEDFIIESVVNPHSSEATLDRSFEEILDAYQSGKNILFKFKNRDTTYFYLKPAIQYICYNGQIVEFIFTVLNHGNLDTIGEYVIGLDADDGSTYVEFNEVYAEDGEPRIIAISDVTAAPTMEDFNALLAALRASGLMAT